jgi:hypothetical protein
MLYRQRGFMSLQRVLLVSMLVAGVAVTVLMSARLERNLFSEGVDKAKQAVSDSRAAPVLEAAKQAAAGPEAAMRKCVIKGKTVISNTDCVDANPTSKDIKIQVTRGVEAPKLPPPAATETDSHKKLVDKWIEKQEQ